MKALVVGSGGREHTISWKLSQSPLISEVIAAPGNPGIDAEPKCRCLPISSDDLEGLCNAAQNLKIDITLVGPEAPLVAGITEKFEAAGLKIFGPSSRAAMLEGSKVFAKDLMSKYGIPTAGYKMFESYEESLEFVTSAQTPKVIKADGLAAGKGVFVCGDMSECRNALDDIFIRKLFGEAGKKVVIEECLQGEEASFIAFTDGNTVLPFASSQDHKAIFDGDKGPNTGGMGAYSPAPVVTDAIHDQIMNSIMIPTVQAMHAEGIEYRGFLYAGVMIQDGIAKVLEFNVRMGDPEAQPLLFRMKSDLVPLIQAALSGSLHEHIIEWYEQAAVCVVLAAGGYPGSYGKGEPISGLDQIRNNENVKVFHAGTGIKDGRIVTAGGRVLGVTAKADTIPGAIETAYRAVDHIHWDGMQYRKDIGKKALNR